jgi:hypothetical protein
VHVHPAGEILARLREEGLAHEVEVGGRIAALEGRLVAVRIEDEGDGARRRVEGAAAFARLVAIGPFVVAGRVDDRLGERLPVVGDQRVVRLGAELLARVDIAHVQDDGRIRVCVDRAHERGKHDRLRSVGGREAVGHVADHGNGELRMGVVVAIAAGGEEGK